MNQVFYRQLLSTKKLTKQQLNNLKIKFCSETKTKNIPTDIELLLNAPDSLVPRLRKILLTKPNRTISGISAIAVMTKPRKCPHGKCAMCPGGPDSAFGTVPQSYTGTEPATRRGIRNNYDPYLQIFNRLEQYIALGHNHDKIEIIIMGGTFPAAPKIYQENFITYCYKALNDFSRLFYKDKVLDFVKFKKFFMLPGDIEDSKRQKLLQKRILDLKKQSNLKKEQNRNEKAIIKCVGLTIETRPDYATKKHALELLRLGCTRVELGAQSVYNSALKKIRRGHTVKDTITATKTLKDLGFKINYHYMLGLPGITKNQEIKGLLQLFSEQNFQPDMLKLYPCMVLQGTKLHSQYKKKTFQPITTKKAVDILSTVKPLIPKYVRIMRVQRDIPTHQTIAGVDRTNLRQYIKQEMKRRSTFCKCIKCREASRSHPKRKLKTIIIEYPASGGTEYFISYEDQENIYGYCRLRIPDQQLTKEITKQTALIRELHVVGQATKIGSKGTIQHTGIGKKLLKTAEQIAGFLGKDKIVIISGIGAREYYRKLGYKRQRYYMTKKT